MNVKFVDRIENSVANFAWKFQLFRVLHFHVRLQVFLASKGQLTLRAREPVRLQPVDAFVHTLVPTRTKFPTTVLTGKRLRLLVTLPAMLILGNSRLATVQWLVHSRQFFQAF